ncbi:MAG TPA: hypothetical protein VFW22_15130 [Pseudolabrys sp.]|nr:hypothetical protein [Pseudolabrys sp.]
MNHQVRNAFAHRTRNFSRRTLFLGAACLAAFVVASFIDLDAVLSYFKVIGHGSPLTTLETGAIVSIACAVPFLATGMSISADAYAAQRHRE